jgi:hypothetical protein
LNAATGQHLVMVEIDGIPATRERSIQILVKATGRPAWIPREIRRRPIQFHPGRVYLPSWLAGRILNPKPRTA